MGFTKCFKLTCIIWACILLAVPTVGLSKDAKEDLVAEGDGFKLTRQEISNLIDYSKKRQFKSSDEEHIEAALQLKLFAREAWKIELVPELKDEYQEISEESIDVLGALRKKYVAMLAESFPVTDKEIHSYYWSYPERFKDWESFHEEKDKEAAEPELLPLDEELREKIRKIIVSANLNRIIRDALDDLKRKYNIRLINE